MENIVIYCQLTLTPEQTKIIAEKHFGWSHEELYNYYKSKICGHLLLPNGPHISREEHADFQDLLDLGIESLLNIKNAEPSPAPVEGNKNSIK